MLTVITLCTGDKYPLEYVEKLQRAVSQNLTLQHEFVCVMRSEFPGWWGKIEMFKREGPHLFLDLDVVITGSLDDLCHTDAEIRTGLNWAQSGHGGCQSSVMYWENARKIYDWFRPERITWPPVSSPGVLWGDQEWITEMRDDKALTVDYFDPAHLVSYKYHCRHGLPKGARVVAFHGEPKPADVQDDWVKRCWS